MKIYGKLGLMSVLILVWMLGVSGADSFADNGMLWLCLVMVFAPMLIGMWLGKKGFWNDLNEWMNEKEKKIFGHSIDEE